MPKKKPSSKRSMSKGDEDLPISDDEIDKFHHENEEKVKESNLHISLVAYRRLCSQGID